MSAFNLLPDEFNFQCQALDYDTFLRFRAWLLEIDPALNVDELNPDTAANPSFATLIRYANARI